MAKICIQCEKKVGVFSPDPFELLNGQILCYNCSESIKSDITKLYSSKTEDSFNEIKENILHYSKEHYNDSVIACIVELIDNIFANNDYIAEDKRRKRIECEELENGLVFEVDGVRGRHLRVYEDKIVIDTKANMASFITGNVSDGEKTIYYVDCVGVQFKQSGALIGYLQLETSGGQMNNKGSNFFAENSFTFDTTKISNVKMAEIVDYIKKRIETYKFQHNTPVNTISEVDEIKKFKELLDEGIITQEEFEAKKKQILGI